MAHHVYVAYANRADPGPRRHFARVVVVPGPDASWVRDGLAVRTHMHVRLPLRVAPRAADLASMMPDLTPRLAPMGLAHELHHRLRLRTRPVLWRRVRAWRLERRVVVRRKEHLEAVRPACALLP